MNCKYCGTENQEIAVFCERCGKRLDGTATCPACGQQISESARFCIYCGAKTGACSVQGTPETPPPSSEPVDATQSASKWKKTVDLCGLVFAMLGLLCTFAFTFAIGFTINTEGAYILNTDPDSIYLYHFFSKAYKVVAENLELLSTTFASAPTEYYAFSVYFPIVLGTITAVGVIVSVVTLFIVSLVRAIRRLLGKSEKDYAKLTIATYLTYLLGTLLIYMLFASNYESSSALGNENMSVGLNKATLAGVILGGASLFLFLACRIAVKGQALENPSVIATIVFSSIGIAVGAVLLAFAVQAPIGIKDGATKGFVPIISFLEAVGLNFALTSKLSAPVSEFAIGLISFSIQCTLILLVTFGLLHAARNLVEGRRKDLLGYAIPIFILAVVQFISCFSFADMALTYLGVKDVSFIYTVPIVFIAFSALYLGIAIAENSLWKKSLASQQS